MFAAVLLLAQAPASLLHDADEARKDKSSAAQKRALDLYRRAADAAADPADQARAFIGAGQSASALGDSDTAFDYWKRAATAAAAAGNRTLEADANYFQAYLLLQQQRPAEAVPSFERAAALLEQVGNLPRAAIARNNLGAAWGYLGETRHSLDAFETALALRERLHDTYGQALTLSGIAPVEWRRGEYQKALETFEKSLSLFSGLKAVREQADVLNNEGLLLADLGQTAQAESRYQEALRLWTSAHDRAGEARTLNNLGMLLAVGSPTRAMPLLRRARDTFDQLKDTRSKAYTLHNLADALTSLRQYVPARDAYAESLALKRESADRSGEAYTLRSLGNLETRQRRFPQAVERFTEALAIWRALEDRNGEAATLADLSYCESEAATLEPAIAHAEDALRLIESSRADLTAPNLRMSFLASWDELYELLTDLWMRRHAREPGKGFDIAAFDARERGRARVLLDSLTRSVTEAATGADADAIREERRLREKLLAQGRLLSDVVALGRGKAREEQVRRELSAVEFDYQQALSRNHARSERAVVRSRPVPLAEIRPALPAGATLIVYGIGRHRGYVWSVTRDRVLVRTLPGRAVIEPLVRQMRAAATARIAGSDATFDARRQRVASADAAFDTVAQTLSRLLIAPVAPGLHRRVLIVPDGPLHFLPFAALPVPGQSEPLLAAHELIWLPSASFAAIPPHQSSVHRVAIFADPVYRPDDSRLTAPHLTSAPHPASGNLSLRRLASSGEEGREIARLAAGGASLRTGVEADKSALVAAAAQDFDAVHLAVHTLLDAANPQTSGIALSMFTASGGLEDGLLRLPEIYNLHVHSGLVVLSSCESHLGKEYAGEGLASVAHGLLYAGARQVVASLWPVADGATTPLMRRMYRELLQAGAPPSEALRRAQLALRAEPRYRAPFYWAGFLVEGF